MFNKSTSFPVKSKVSRYKVIYFPVRGRFEACRLLLHDNGIPFEEVNCAPTFEVWKRDWKPKMIKKVKCMPARTNRVRQPFGQAPLLVDGDFELAQSMAILRYLARKHGLTGSTPQEEAFLDMFNDGIEDLRNLYVTLIYQNYENEKEAYIKQLPQRLGPLEYLLKKREGGKEFVFGKKITFVDYNLLDLLDIHQVLAPGCLDEFPTLEGHYKRMLMRPRIASYRHTDEFQQRPINYNGKQ